MADEKINILLVDDQPQNLLSLEAILGAPDYNLVRALSGEEALKRLLRENFTVILLDAQMPQMDGFETAIIIKRREQSKHIPIIFLTAMSPDERHISKGYLVGAVDYLFKPLNPEILRSKVAVFVDLYKTNRQLLKEREARADAEAVQETLSFLVDAGDLLASSLDYKTILAQVAELAVPKIADWCAVDIVEEDGAIQRVATMHADPEKVKLAQKLERRYPPDRLALRGAAQVIRTGQPEIYPEIQEALIEESALDKTHLKIIRQLGPVSAMVVPLIARGKTLGAITFVTAESGRHYGSKDLLLAQELAGRAALAIDNARLYSSAQDEIAERKEITKRLAAQHAVTRILAESNRLEEAAPKILQAACESFGWELGALWRVDHEGALLRCVEIWNPSTQRFRAFDEGSRQKTFSLKDGLPGRVWADGKPLWISDLRNDSNFPRKLLAAEAGFNTALALPILKGKEILGILEFFSQQARLPNSDLLEVMSGIGSQVGQFIERKEAERAMKESELRKAAILESALDCIVTMDDLGRIIEFNPAAESIFGYRRDQVIGKEMAELMIPPALRERHRAGLSRYLATGEGPILGKRIEITAMRSDGTEFPVELAVIPIPLDGAPLFSGYLRDITKRKEAEEALKLKTLEAEESNRLKSQFVSNVSHELRTPINAIIGYSYILSDEIYGALSREQKESLERINVNANDLLRLVNDVLDLSKVESGKLAIHLERLYLHPMLKEVVASMKPLLDQKSVVVRWNRIQDLPSIESDGVKVKQILTNLLSNAAKFTPQGSITISGVDRPDKEGLEIAIQDTGIGIKPEEISKIFTEFHQVDAELTRQYGGVGLGLRIVKDLLHFLKGEIRVESVYGKGSTFTVFLPYRFDRRKLNS